MARLLCVMGLLEGRLALLFVGSLRAGLRWSDASSWPGPGLELEGDFGGEGEAGEEGDKVDGGESAGVVEVAGGGRGGRAWAHTATGHFRA